MKSLIAAVALEKGLVQPEETNTCAGALQEGRTRYHCDGHRAHGTVNLTEAIRRSCNVYFYRLGARIGVEGLAPYARAVGFGRRTGVDLPGEVAGIYPDRAWRQRAFASSPADQSWSRGKDYHLAIGQGYMAVTPLQVASLMATLANGGHPVTPRLWLEGSAAPPKPPLFARQTLAVVQQAMDEVCNFGTPGARGTAYSAFHNAGEVLAVRVAGKTGTADTGRENEAPHAWFAGFAPVGAPQVAFCVFVEHGGHGGEVAAPLAYRLLREVYGTRRAPRAEAHGVAEVGASNGGLPTE
jgi:penicillin-binding protein 2